MSLGKWLWQQPVATDACTQGYRNPLRTRCCFRWSWLFDFCSLHSKADVWNRKNMWNPWQQAHTTLNSPREHNAHLLMILACSSMRLFSPMIIGPASAIISAFGWITVLAPATKSWSQSWQVCSLRRRIRFRHKATIGQVVEHHSDAKDQAATKEHSHEDLFWCCQFNSPNRTHENLSHAVPNLLQDRNDVTETKHADVASEMKKYWSTPKNSFLEFPESLQVALQSYTPWKKIIVRWLLRGLGNEQNPLGRLGSRATLAALLVVYFWLESVSASKAALDFSKSFHPTSPFCNRPLPMLSPDFSGA